MLIYALCPFEDERTGGLRTHKRNENLLFVYWSSNEIFIVGNDGEGEREGEFWSFCSRALNYNLFIIQEERRRQPSKKKLARVTPMLKIDDFSTIYASELGSVESCFCRFTTRKNVCWVRTLGVLMLP